MLGETDEHWGEDYPGDLKELLENVIDTYDDFVVGVLCAVKHDEKNRDKVIDYIVNNPDSKSNNIIEYLDELGI